MHLELKQLMVIVFSLFLAVVSFMLLPEKANRLQALDQANPAAERHLQAADAIPEDGGWSVKAIAVNSK